jgi:MFS family permease
MDDADRYSSPSDSPWSLPSDAPSGVLPHDVLDLGYRAFKTIWLSPRETIRRIVDVNPEYHVNLLIALGGIAESLDRASSKNAGDRMPLAAILGMALILGPVGALIGAWISAHLIRITGNWINGKGEDDEIKAAIGWSTVPTVVGLALWVPLLILLGQEMFTEETPSIQGNAGVAIVLVAITFGLMLLNIWSFVLLCNCVAEVQGYTSAWKGLGNIILSGLIIIVPLAALIGVIAFLAQG